MHCIVSFTVILHSLLDNTCSLANLELSGPYCLCSLISLLLFPFFWIAILIWVVKSKHLLKYIMMHRYGWNGVVIFWPKLSFYYLWMARWLSGRALAQEQQRFNALTSAATFCCEGHVLSVFMTLSSYMYVESGDP